MGPALTQISDKAERGKVLNRSWQRYGTINSIALVTLVTSWRPNRRAELGVLWISGRERALILAKDVAVTGVVVALVAINVALLQRRTRRLLRP